LGTPLSGVTFVVVDLETTGGNPRSSDITEIGAVKVRGGEVLGEFQTLVNPGDPIPAFISVLTGITDSMVAGAPNIASALPAFLEFAAGSVLVAHNAPFDIGFLRANCTKLGHSWPGHQVIDTVHLARHLVSNDEVPNRKLGSLARLFGAVTTPDHRALHDAQATVDVLHALLGRVGNLGVNTLEELASYTSRVRPEQRRKRFLADGLPRAPGVYVFKDDRDRVLYVGTSVDIQRRVRSYFTASEHRSRMAHMVGLAATVTPIVCATVLEAQVRELRLIAEHKPRFNRRSRHPEKSVWLKLTVEAFPRLSVVRERRDDKATYAGPFGSRALAEAAAAAVHEVVPLRQCTQRLSATARSSACALADIGRCGAPCIGRQSQQEYAVVAGRVAEALDGDARDLVRDLDERMHRLGEGERFEEAATVRDRMVALIRAADRNQRVTPLAVSPELVAARPGAVGGWEFVCVRYGKLAGTTLSPPGADPRPYIDALVDTAEVVSPHLGRAPACHPEEADKILRWLESPDVRLVRIDGEWTCPVNGAGQMRERLQLLRDRPDTGFSDF
ncbi:MAG: DEDD exonuclease domain-containing protein, partial [Rhodococcus sp. (in: high G+C Gram-positive bacteria)]